MSEDDKEQSVEDLHVIARALFEWVSDEDEGIVKNWLKDRYHETIGEIACLYADSCILCSVQIFCPVL
ncbi:unnamed protein product [marine sediment metagenome]|uniref:Uncharacterized protein n=1 Tax=marine sediment metagenome TaxID=412755 RepID=X0ZQW1_9ZZZZ